MSMTPLAAAINAAKPLCYNYLFCHIWPGQQPSSEEIDILAEQYVKDKATKARIDAWKASLTDEGITTRKVQRMPSILYNEG